MTPAELHLVVGNEALQMVYVDRLFHEVSSALGLAKVRAYPTDSGGHGSCSRMRFSASMLSSADESEVALDVDAGRTGQLAGGHTIPVVLPQEQLDEKLPRLANIRGVGGDHHAVPDWGAAGRDKFRLARHTDNTNPATLQGSKNFTVTERWNGDAILPGREENSGPRLSLNLSPVNRQLNSLRHERSLLFRFEPEGPTAK
jgi:hypothetical protein